jgi:probable rRNA maturation factor
VIIHLVDQQKALPFDKDAFEPLVSQVLRLENQACDEVSIHLVESQTISSLHEQFFDDPSPTDCISFPLDDEEESFYRILGEVFICPETALNYAKEHSVDPYEETTLYLVHALLHLMGYDDIEEEDILEMRQAEKRHLDQLRTSNNLLRPPLTGDILVNPT